MRVRASAARGRRSRGCRRDRLATVLAAVFQGRVGAPTWRRTCRRLEGGKPLQDLCPQSLFSGYWARILPEAMPRKCGDRKNPALRRVRPPDTSGAHAIYWSHTGAPRPVYADMGSSHSCPTCVATMFHRHTISPRFHASGTKSRWATAARLPSRPFRVSRLRRRQSEAIMNRERSADLRTLSDRVRATQTLAFGSNPQRSARMMSW